MDFEGVVHKIMPATSGTSARGPWQRQEVIFDLQSNSQYPRKACVTFFNKPEEVARLKEGDACIVSFDIESREYNGRWYTDLRAWRVQPKQAEAPAGYAEAPMAAAPAPAAAPMPTTEPLYATQAAEADDLPF